MRPLDPRLLRYAAAARTFFGAGIVLGIVRTAATLAFCWLLSHAIVGAIAGRSLDELLPGILFLARASVVRAGTIWAMDVASARGAAMVKSQLRRRLVAGIARLGPGWLGGRNRVDAVTTAGPALDVLDGYFSLFLPQLILTAIATPLVIAAIFLQDVMSGILVIVALPLIPVFMILIGLAKQAVQLREWVVLAHLSSRFLDVVGGLATLKIFGRQQRQATRIAVLTEENRIETMKVLRLSFLSGFALELIGSLSVALVEVALVAVSVVAVSAGLRLIDGSLGLSVGLFVLCCSHRRRFFRCARWEPTRPGDTRPCRCPLCPYPGPGLRAGRTCAHSDRTGFPCHLRGRRERSAGPRGIPPGARECAAGGGCDTHHYSRGDPRRGGRRPVRSSGGTGVR